MVDKKIIVSASAGLIAAIIVVVLFLVFTKEKAPKKEAVGIKVLAAAADIPVGTEITPQQVTYMTVSGATPPPGVFSDISQVSGLRPLRTVKTGEILTVNVFSKVEKESIPEGSVAVSLKVNDVSGVSGMISQGDKVDVIGAFRDPEKQQEKVSRIILQAVKVLSINRPETKGSAPRDYTIVLLMKPEEAQKLLLTYTSGEYALALRGNADQSIYKEQPISVSEVSGSGKKAPVVKAVTAKKPIGKRQPVAVEKVIEIVEVK
ncbi:MAG: Flp pilus assembly protein CpaB [Nitrospirales bacterium]|nr:Flp pilus assembly protein CpaB [Nitrospirales bacterium]